MSLNKTIRDVRQSKMRGQARAKLWRIRRDKRFFGPDLEQLARLEMAFAPEEVINMIPADKKKEWAEVLGGRTNG